MVNKARRIKYKKKTGKKYISYKNYIANKKKDKKFNNKKKKKDKFANDLNKEIFRLVLLLTFQINTPTSTPIITTFTSRNKSQ